MPRHNQFREQPEQLPIEVDEPSASVRFDPLQRRAFGSVPTLVGKNMDIPKFEQLDGHGWERTSADTMRQGLYNTSDKARYAVNGVALSPEFYEQIIRNQKAFKTSIGAKTLAANRLSNTDLTDERYGKSQTEPLVAKQIRHEMIIHGLKQQEYTLETLLEWQRQPGYWRTSENELRIMATSAWDQTFDGMLRTLRENYNLSGNELVDMQQALAYRLLRGPQDSRMQEWGEHLTVGKQYTQNVRMLFEQSERRIMRDLSA